MAATGTYHGRVARPYEGREPVSAPPGGGGARTRRRARVGRLLSSALHSLLDQSQPFGRLALVHTVFSAGSTLVTISLAGSLFFSVSPSESKSKVLLYLLLTLAPFAVVAPALSPLLDRGIKQRRAGIALACAGSALLALLMAGGLKTLLLYPEAFGVLVLSKLYLVGKAALVPTMVGEGDDLASANAKLAVLAALAGFVVSPIGIGVLQLGASWVLRLDIVVFVAGAVVALRLPRGRIGSASLQEGRRTRPIGTAPDGRPLHGPPQPAAAATDEPLWGAADDLGGAAATGRAQRSARRQDRPRAGLSSTAQVKGRGARPRWGAFRLGRLGIPIVPEVAIALIAMTVIRGAFGFMTFFLAFGLRAIGAATIWYGVLLLASGVGGISGSMGVPFLRRVLSEQRIVLVALLGCALVGVLTGWNGSLYVQAALALVVAAANTTAKPAFDSLAQRHVPTAALGRAFARFETQLQLSWVVCALIAVVITLSLRSGDLLIATACGVAAIFYLSLGQSLSRHGEASAARHHAADMGGGQSARAEGRPA